MQPATAPNPLEVDGASAPAGPWNPGISSHLTPELWRMCTIFRSENVFTTYAEAVEFSDATGLPFTSLVAWRPERMVLHEVLVRVTSDYEVPDPEGADVPSLGVNFRRMTRTVMQRLSPCMEHLVGAYAPARGAIARVATDELAIAFGRAPHGQQDATIPQRTRGLGWFHRRTSAPRERVPAVREDELVERWRSKSRGGTLEAATYSALVRVVSSVRGSHGGLWGSPDLLAPVVTALACNAHCADLVADRAGPLIAEAAVAEQFRPLPAQDRPIAMSTKGASAAGKSTMRPLMRSLAERMGASWSDFALVSPDIFRRELLDIDALGRQYRYFGTFTSHELEIVDRKLDRYLARKAQRHPTHLLVDRFRFDSFAPDSEEQRQLLARHAKRRLVYYLFMITPPEKTVERAWKRGLAVGRYKPLDDLLAHNVDAYAGMQSFFLARALHPESGNQHYEFVDNDVAVGDVPLTVAFGSGGEFNILDVKRLVDMDRYRKIDVDAHQPKDLYPDALTLAPENNVSFLRTCVLAFPVLNLAHRKSGRLYARFERGRLAWLDTDALDGLDDAETQRALHAIAPALLVRDPRASPAEPARYLDRTRSVTLGRWRDDGS